MTMPHLMNCSHSNYGICESCSPGAIPESGWFPAAIPPSNCRTVIMQLTDGSEDRGFFWSIEGNWYRRLGSKARKNAVHPVSWKEDNEATQ